MLDAVIELTGADKGFILLNDDAFASERASTGSRAERARASEGAAPRRRDARLAQRAQGRRSPTPTAPSATASCAR